MSQFVISDTKEIESRLLKYLKKELDDSKIVYETPPTRLQLGVETLTFHFQLKTRQKKFNEPLVLKIYPEFTPPDIVRLDSCVHSVLANEGYPVPKAHLTSIDKSILGGAFFIMDFLPGKNLLTESAEIVLTMLGETHAALHKINPSPLIKELNKQGFDENQYSAESFLKYIVELPKEMPFIRDAVNWVLDNRQTELETLAICHGDFHSNNILIYDGQVSGILDWHPSIADPAYDIARTIQALSVFDKVFTPEPDWALLEVNTQKYLNAYQLVLPLNDSKILFGRVVYSIFCLMLGNAGSEFLRHSQVVNDQIDFIHKVTGIRLPMPDWVYTAQVRKSGACSY